MSATNKRPSPDATSASSASNPPFKKPKILTTPSGIALPQTHWFDPWNSSSTGHQRAENNLAGSTSWRDSRNLKLKAQYKGGHGGGKRVADTVGAGSEDFGKDGRKVNGSWRDGASGLRDKTQRSLKDCLMVEGKAEEDASRCGEPEALEEEEHDEVFKKALAASLKDVDAASNCSAVADTDDDLGRAIAASMAEHTTHSEDINTIPPSNQADEHTYGMPYTALTACGHLNDNEDDGTADAALPKQLFHNLVFYINGSTAPLISDHRLKYLITHHGGSLTISHARKQVTHVIIGTTHSQRNNRLVTGAGGALAGTKIQKEIARTRGRGVKFVGAQWVIDSVKIGKRVAEAGYENVKLGGARQGSVFEKFRTAKPGGGVGADKKMVADMTDEELGIV